MYIVGIYIYIAQTGVYEPSTGSYTPTCLGYVTNLLGVVTTAAKFKGDHNFIFTAQLKMNTQNIDCVIAEE